MDDWEAQMITRNGSAPLLYFIKFAFQSSSTETNIEPEKLRTLKKSGYSVLLKGFEG